jgi:hypothetical protein
MDRYGNGTGQNDSGAQRPPAVRVTALPEIAASQDNGVSVILRSNSDAWKSARYPLSYVIDGYTSMRYPLRWSSLKPSRLTAYAKNEAANLPNDLLKKMREVIDNG